MLLFDQLYQASTRRNGAVLLVSGPVGVGKTALLQAMVARAGHQGGWCFVVTGSARERDHPFGVMDRMIQSMRGAGMADPFPGGLDSGEDFFAMMDRVAATVRDFARGQTLLVGIDDVHFADEQSLRGLSYLIRRVESSRVVVVLNESTSYEREMAGLWAEMLHLPFCRRVRLAPLGAADVAEQLRERFGAIPGRAFAQFCADVSGGIPLLLHALIDDLATGSDPAAGEPGGNFRQAVLRSLHRCAPGTTTVGEAVAVLGDHATTELVAELAGVDVALAEDGIRDLREMGLLGWDWFRHPRTRAAALAGIPFPERPAMHSRAAELLRESGAPAGAVAEHLIAAQDGVRAPWRVAILCEAAREAMAAGDVDSATSRLRHAVAASSGEEQRARTGVLLADAQWHADPGRAARRLDELVRDARAGLLAGTEVATAISHLRWLGDFPTADELLRLTGVEASSLAQLWARFGPAGGDRDGGGRDSHDEAGTPVLARPVAAAGFLSAAAGLALDGEPAHRSDRRPAGPPPGAPLTPSLDALVELVRDGRLDEAVSLGDRLRKEESIHRVPMRRAMIEAIEAVAVMRAGDSATALARAREVFDAVAPAAWGVVVGLPLSVAIRAATDLGDISLARSYLAVPVPPAMFETPFALPYLLALGWYHLAMGDAGSALRYTRSGLELVTRWGVDPAVVVAGAGPCGPAGAPAAPAEDGAKLTGAERRVADLAAAGNTNRQIADRLFITVSTVEQHLTKVYRKLNVRSRSGLQRYGC
ncbi:LuxR C-terminal-related transcriptional regulator [Actinoplanes sp. CA-131856]